ncbi:acetyltransferase [Ruficoccus amylovorans]|uniref:Acetyltransferase n=1 Tax=Ruficoccus amylovorans TaxID=1804625 RepID=A0A842HFM2_9BACT|nr:acetyltransferase [Ruficoccus amylovorans]MBC2594324.1 acetyltransferase [Ruficoccus amylovorans]
MQEILVLGAGGLGREVWSYLEHKLAVDAEFATTYRLKGFLDDDAQALDGYDYPGGVVGGISSYKPASSEWLVCALGAPSVKARLCPELKKRGARFLTFVHPTSTLGRNAVLGEGVVLAPYTQVSADARMGDFSFLNCHSTCGHDAKVGPCCTVSSYCDLTGFVELGEQVFMGSHATVIPGRRVGDGCTIGAGSAVVTHLPAGARVLGVPAKPFMRK